VSADKKTKNGGGSYSFMVQRGERNAFGDSGLKRVLKREVRISSGGRTLEWSQAEDQEKKSQVGAPKRRRQTEV